MYKLTNLLRLYLDNNEISEDGITELVRNIPLGLERLTLSQNQIGDDGVITLSSNLYDNLQELYLKDNLTW